VWVSVGCSSLEIPRGPNLEEVAEQYDSPEGQLPENEMELFTSAVEVVIETIETLGNLEFVVQTLEEVGKTIRNASKSDNDSFFKITGVSEVESICPGFGDLDATDPGNGTLDFTITFERSFVDEVIWGQFTDCRFQKAGLDVTLNSTMDLFLGEPEPLDRLRLDYLLFRLDGEYTLNGTTDSLGLDFRLRNDAIEFRVPAVDGDVIVALKEGLEAVSVRAENSSYCCNFDERFCEGLVGNSCDSPTDGTRISW
jgi:hypothetical protein